MKVNQISEPVAEQMQNLYKDYPADMDSLLYIMGQLVSTFNTLTNRNISLGENVDCEVKTFTHKAGASVDLEFIRDKPMMPKQILVGRVTTAGPQPTTSVQILDWTIQGQTVKGKNVTGLNVGQTYDITLTLFY